MATKGRRPQHGPGLFVAFLLAAVLAGAGTLRLAAGSLSPSAPPLKAPISSLSE